MDKIITLYRITLPFILITLFLSCSKNPSRSKTNEFFKWIPSTPEEQGLISDTLTIAKNKAEEMDFIHSMLIVKNGFLVVEDYFNGYDKTVTNNIRSVSKSFLSALVGIALRENYLVDLNQKMIDYFPEYKSPDLDPRVNDILIRHLLTMKTGFDFTESITSEFYFNENWIKSAIELPLKYNPGERWSYTTPTTHLLSAIITKATGTTTHEFAQTYLFEPLSININRWITDPQGYYFGGSEMYFTPRDMAKFGYLYLNQGFLDGDQIIPESWIEESLKDYSGNENWTWGAIYDIGYGYLWWLGKMAGYEIYFALGYGGQYIIIIPTINMIIVTTCDSDILDYDEADAHERGINELLAQHILSAVIN